MVLSALAECSIRNGRVCIGSLLFFFFSSRRRHTRFDCDWSSDVCSSDLATSRAGEFSASAAAPTAAAHIGWEIFGSASATAADGLKIIVTGTGTFVAPASGGGASSAATRGGTGGNPDAGDTVTGSGHYTGTWL